MEVQIINKYNLLPGTDLYKLAKLTEADKKNTNIKPKQTKHNYDSFVRTTPRSPERLAQIAKRKKVAKRQRIAAGISALGIVLGIGLGTGLGQKNNNNLPDTVIAAEITDTEDNIQDTTEYTQTEEARLKAEEEARLKAEEEARLKAEEEARLKAEEEARLKAEEEARLKAEEEARLKAEEEARLKAEEEARLKAEEEARLKAEEEARLKAEEEARLKAEEEARLKAEEEARLKAEEEARLKAEEEARLHGQQLTPERIEELHKILDENPDISEAYNNMLSALKTFSKQIGENGIELIKKYVDELGDGKVDVTDVYKVLFIESGGRIYDSKGNYLTSSGKAYGPFQIRKIAETDINQRYGTNYDVLDPYDNLSVHVLLLRWLHNYRSTQLANGKVLPTGNNLKHAMMWGYHDGAYASSISYYGQDYLNKYDKLSVVDQYPDLYNLMAIELNG